MEKNIQTLSEVVNSLREGVEELQRFCTEMSVERGGRCADGGNGEEGG